jgi:hypothetical protein
MFDTETRALLRAIHDEVCLGLSRYETSTKSHVASRILQAASEGLASVDDLRRVGNTALQEAGTDRL